MNTHLTFKQYALIFVVAWLCAFPFVHAMQSPTGLAFELPAFPTIHLQFGKPAVDIDKLALAVGAHETGNCTAKVGSARFNNCHGFRVSGHFLHFKTKQESYERFKTLWTKSYGGFPTIRLATTYVCGGRWPTGEPCPGGSPRNWLASVSAIYASL